MQISEIPLRNAFQDLQQILCYIKVIERERLSTL